MLKGSNPNAPDSTNLKNFFQNLLNKNAPSTSSSSAPSAAAAAAAASSTPTLAQMSQNLTADQSSKKAKFFAKFYEYFNLNNNFFLL